jgi:hypothetical protein
MLRLIALAPALLAGCSTAPAQAPLQDATPVHGETPGHTCKTEGTEQFVGQTRSDELGAEIKRASNAAVVRWAPPGVMLTMDFRADRVTVRLDAANKVTQINCG